MKYLEAKGKKYFLRSTVETFFAGFGVELLVHIDQISLENVQDGALMGLLFVLVRSGIKALTIAYLEYKTK